MAEGITLTPPLPLPNAALSGPGQSRRACSAPSVNGKLRPGPLKLLVGQRAFTLDPTELKHSPVYNAISKARFICIDERDFFCLSHLQFQWILRANECRSFWLNDEQSSSCSSFLLMIKPLYRLPDKTAPRPAEGQKA